MKNLVFVPLVMALLPWSVWAAPINVSYSSTASGPYYLGADTFSELGQSGSLALDDAVSTTNTINRALLNVQIGSNNNMTATFTFDLTIAGITKTLSQSADWAITFTQDWIDAEDVLTPVLFATSVGNWEVALNAFRIDAYTVGDHYADVKADFTPVPEPASLALLGIGLAGLAASRKKR